MLDVSNTQTSTAKFFWESSKSRLSTKAKSLTVYRKRGQGLNYVCQLGYELPVTPPKVSWTDSADAKRNRNPYRVPVLPAGWGEISRAFLQEGSNAIVSGRSIFVDEYRNEYPQISDPRSDPIVLDYNLQFILGKKMPKRRQIRKIEEAFWLAGRFGSEFGHFINSFLPRIHWLQSHPKWGTLPVVISANLPKNHIDFLNLLAPHLDYIFAEPGEELYFKKVIFCPSRVFSPYNVKSVTQRPQPNVFVEPNEFSHLRRALLEACRSKNNPYSGRDFYLTRFGYDRRKLIDNIKIYKNLEILGLTPIDLEKLKPEEQIQFWSGARTVVGELSSWLYLSVLSSQGNIFALNSDRDSQWWADISGIESVSGNEIQLFLGLTLEEYQGDTSESGPHRPWTLSVKGQEALQKAILSKLK